MGSCSAVFVRRKLNAYHEVWHGSTQNDDPPPPIGSGRHVGLFLLRGDALCAAHDSAGEALEVIELPPEQPAPVDPRDAELAALRAECERAKTALLMAESRRLDTADSLREARAECERLKLRVMDSEGMAECTTMLRDDLISMGLIDKSVPPMFLTEAIVSLVKKERDECERLRSLTAEWERKAEAWLASPQAAQRLQGYRELAQMLNDSEQECERLRKDAERIDFLESTIRQRSAVWLLPCGESLRFMQVRHLDGDIDNHPTVEGLRAAIDAAMSEPKPQDQAA